MIKKPKKVKSTDNELAPNGIATLGPGGLYTPNTGPRAIYIFKLGSKVIRVGRCGTSNQANYKSPYGRLGTHLSPPGKTASAFFTPKKPHNPRSLRTSLIKKLITEEIQFFFWQFEDPETTKCLEKLLSEKFQFEDNSTSYCRDKDKDKDNKSHKRHKQIAEKIFNWMMKPSKRPR